MTEEEEKPLSDLCHTCGSEECIEGRFWPVFCPLYEEVE